MTRAAMELVIQDTVALWTESERKLADAQEQADTARDMYREALRLLHTAQRENEALRLRQRELTAMLKEK